MKQIIVALTILLALTGCAVAQENTTAQEPKQQIDIAKIQARLADVAKLEKDLAAKVEATPEWKAYKEAFAKVQATEQWKTYQNLLNEKKYLQNFVGK